MRLVDIHIDGFGVWTDLRLEQLAADLTVIYGPNEAGKTTLMQFIRATLYGYSAAHRQRYLPPVHGGPAGGCLQIATLGGHYQVQRQGPKSAHAEDRGEVNVVAAGGTPRGTLAVAELLGHLDETVFSNVFAIGLAELQELSLLQEGEAADELYKLAAGVDRVSLVDVQRHFDRCRQRLLSDDGRAGKLVELLAERDRLWADVERLSQRGRRWIELVRQRRQFDQSVQDIANQLGQLRHTATIIETAEQLRETWLAYQAVQQEADQLQAVPEIPDELVAKVDRLNRLISQRQQRLVQYQQEREQAADECRRIEWQPHLWKARHKLTALKEQVASLSTLDKQIAELEPLTQKLETEFRQACQEFGVAPQVALSGETRVDHRLLAVLRKPAQAVRRLSARLRSAQQQHDEALQEWHEIDARWQSALAACGTTRLEAARDEVQTLIKKLQQRQQLDEQIEKIQRQKKDLDEECLTLLKTPLMPLRHILAWGSIVALGVMLTLIALFSEWVGDLRVPLILFGLTCTGGGFLLKHAYQQLTSQELDERQRSLVRAKRQLQQLLEERQALDTALPSTVPLTQQWEEAQERWRRLQELVPLQEELAAAQRRVQEAEKRVQELTAALREARQRWRLALAKHQLSGELSPREVRQFVMGHERLAAIRRELADRKHELERKQSARLEVARATSTVLRELGLTPTGDDPREHVRQLAEAVAAQERLRQERHRRNRLLAQANRRLKRCQRNLQRLRLYRQAIYSRVGVQHDAEFQLLVENTRRRRAVNERLTELGQRVRLILGARCTWEEIEPYLKPSVDLLTQRQQIHRQLDQLQQQHAQLLAQRGELAAEAKNLAADDSWDAARLELAAVEARIRHAAEEWRRLAIVTTLLEKVQRKYEAERQPEALQEASQYLRILTGGRYQRLWTPLGSRALRVDDEQGRTLTLDVLSQGTREAIFLSLRFALAAAYARRGAWLPLILDDVLANFDRQRTIYAVQAIRQFVADGHQVLFFTCHDHVAALFTQMPADVRYLPDHATPHVVVSPGACPCWSHPATRTAPDASVPAGEHGPEHRSPHPPELQSLTAADPPADTGNNQPEQPTCPDSCSAALQHQDADDTTDNPTAENPSNQPVFPGVTVTTTDDTVDASSTHQERPVLPMSRRQEDSRVKRQPTKRKPPSARRSSKNNPRAPLPSPEPVLSLPRPPAWWETPVAESS